MSFFDVPAPPPPPAAAVEEPEWMGPPPGILPGVSPQRVVLFKTERAFSMVSQILVYPNGVEFTLDLRLRYPDERHRGIPGELHGSPGPAGSLPDEFLRLGFLLADGTKWTNLDRRSLPTEGEPQGPVILFRGGGGGGDSYRMRYWMWPLPPEGPVTVVSEWPAFGVAETRAVFDATELRARAGDAVAIWPD